MCSGLIRANILYVKFPNIQTLSGKLSWSHYVEVLRLDDPLETSFYIAQCERNNWSVRELQRQMKSMLFHRLALSKDKRGVLELAKNGVEIQTAEDVVKDPYVLEFTGIPQNDKYLESDLEREVRRILDQE
ncbi:MAG: DUF1016 N-terminal domain-containing protein [Rikenellaceae bacterium]